MEPESGGDGVARCARHPAQVLTGVCSLCLAERLSAVDSAGQRSEIVEISPAAAAESERRVRTTLLSLFQLDDRSSESCDAAACNDKGDPPASSKRSGRASSKAHRHHSCDWTHPPPPLSDAPRHSWDGTSIVGRAFTCSFTCLDDATSSSFCKPPTKTSSAAAVDEAAPQKPISSGPPSLKDHRQRDNGGQLVSPSGLGRKKSQRWSKVWDWSITTPFRDLVKRRGQHMLERSLSESWRDKNVATTESNGRVPASASARTSLSRSLNNVGAGNQNSRLDWQAKKECKLGRSRSVHYSPGNLDSGLLRFYLTPSRSSRRSKNKGRAKRSHSFFARGLFGLQ